MLVYEPIWLTIMQKPALLWLNIIVFTVTGLITLVAVPAYAIFHGFDGWQIAALILGVGFCEISITAGYHRLWSHRAFEAHPIARFVFMLGGTFAAQNSILQWVSDHRRHHRYLDDYDRDPYSAKRGFWFSHIGWMLREYDPRHHTQYDNCKDLQRDPIVMWQHRHYVPLVIGTNFGIPILLGLYHGDLLGMVLLLGVARLTISHHFTFFINSLAHIWGSQPYSDKNSSKDNGFLSLLTMGEGYHNYHHQFQNDYRIGIRWWHFDPTKWLIRSLASIRLAYNLRRTPLERIEISRAQMLFKKTTRKLVHLPHAEDLILRLQDEYEILLQKIDAFTCARKAWLKASKLSAMERVDYEGLKDNLDLLKQNFLSQKKQWLLLNARIA